MHTQVKDIVCSMDVATSSEFNTLYESEKYYFCSEHCLHKFKDNPKKYIEVKKWSIKKSQDSKNEDKGIVYTCPMHPEIQQVGPGSGPKYRRLRVCPHIAAGGQTGQPTVVG